MAGISFTSSGATPGISGGTLANAQRLGLGSGLSINPTGQVSNAHSPVANALNAAQSPTPSPSTPVKKTSITMPDGSSHVTEYHAPPVPDSASGGTNSTTNGSASTPAPTFPGTVSGLINTANTGSSAAQGYTQNTADYGAGNIPIGNEAGAIAKDYGERIARVGQQGASFEGGQRTTGTSPVAEGNAAVTAQTTAASQQDLAAGESAALEGTQQELTGQNQAANAANEAAGQATTAQGQKITGLTSAGNLTQPTSTSQGQTVFNPVTGTFEGGSYQGNLATIVQSIKNGSIGYTAGVDSLSGLSPTAKADVLAALGPGFDTVASDANASAKSSNIQTGGTAQTQAFNTVYSTATNQAAKFSQQQSAINAIGSQALNLMATDPNINKFATQFGNKSINSLQTQLSDPKYAAFNTAIQSLQARIGQALQAGEIPTAATTNASSIANGNITLDALASTLKQVDAEMASFVGTQNDLANYAKSQMNSSGNTTSNSNQHAPNPTGWF